MISMQGKDLVMEIRKLTSYTPAELNLVSGWMQAWWGEAGGYSPEQVRAYLLHAACENRIPQTYAAYHGGLLAGIYHIAMEDLFVRPDLYPWLCNVYVSPAHRGCDIGRALLQSVPGAMRSLGIERLHLYTTHESLYEKFGWTYAGPLHTFEQMQDLQRLYILQL